MSLIDGRLTCISARMQPILFRDDHAKEVSFVLRRRLRKGLKISFPGFVLLGQLLQPCWVEGCPFAEFQFFLLACHDHFPFLPFLSVKFLHQLSPPPFDGFQASCEFPGFRVEVGQLLLELLLGRWSSPLLSRTRDSTSCRSSRYQGLPCMLLSRNCSLPARIAAMISC